MAGERTLTFRVGADVLPAISQMDKLTAKLNEVSSTSENTGDKFTQLDRGAAALAKRLGVEMSDSSAQVVRGLQALYDYLVKVGAPAGDIERSFNALQAAQTKYANSTQTLAQNTSFWKEHGATIASTATSLVAFGTIAVKAFSDSQQHLAQLDAVLKSTAGAAGITRDMAEELAASLSKLTGISKGQIISAETILLQFTKIGKEIFPAATQAVIDLSVRLGKDLPTAALLVGKALENPVGGMNALQRATGKFTEAEADAIKAMVSADMICRWRSKAINSSSVCVSFRRISNALCRISSNV